MKESLLFTRREFLRTTGIVAAAAAMPSFLVRTALAAGASIKGFSDDRILVVVQLGGGNDGLNTVVPHSDDAYYRVRPRLALKDDRLIRLDDHLSLNSRMTGLKSLYDEGLVQIVEGVGYPNPDRSHFRSMEIWHTAVDSDKTASTGWIGRYFDNCCSGSAEPEAGVAVGSERPQAFGGKRGFGVAFSDPSSFGWTESPAEATEEKFQAMNNAAGGGDTLDFLRKVSNDAVVSSDRVRQVAGKYRSKVSYPRDAFGQSLETVAKMIAGNLPTRLYYVTLSGFDTHANQSGAHDNLLERFSTGIAAFQQDITGQGNADRVMVMTFSEFGRRVEENGSGGTDHGTAAPMFIIGTNATAGLAGKRPSLTALDKGDLKYTTDFRSVYASVMGQWLKADPVPVLGREFAQIPVIRG